MSASRSTVHVSLLTMIFAGLMLVKEIALAHTFGVGWETDLLAFASTLPLAQFMFLAVSTNSAVIPVYIRIRDRELHRAAGVARGTLAMVAGISLVLNLALLCSLFFEFDVVWKQSEALVAHRGTLTFLLVALCLWTTFRMLFWILMGLASAEGEFLIPSLSRLVLPVSIIVAIVGPGDFGSIEIVASGMTFGAFAELAIISVWFHRRRSLLGSIDRAGTLEVFRRALPFAVALVLPSLVGFIDRAAAVRIGEGATAVFAYADRLWQVPVQFFVFPLMRVIYPRISESIGKGMLDEVRTIHSQGIVILAAAVIPASIVILIEAPSIIALLFEGKQFSVRDVADTAAVLRAFGLALPVLCLGNALIRPVQAHGLRGLFFLMGLSLFAVKFGLNPVFVARFGVPGLALSTAIGWCVYVLVAAFGLRRQQGALHRAGTAYELFKVFVGSTVFGAGLWFLNRGEILSEEAWQSWVFLPRVVLASIPYAVVIWALRVRYLIDFMKDLRAPRSSAASTREAGADKG